MPGLELCGMSGAHIARIRTTQGSPSSGGWSNTASPTRTTPPHAGRCTAPKNAKSRPLWVCGSFGASGAPFTMESAEGGRGVPRGSSSWMRRRGPRPPLIMCAGVAGERSALGFGAAALAFTMAPVSPEKAASASSSAPAAAPAAPDSPSFSRFGFLAEMVFVDLSTGAILATAAALAARPPPTGGSSAAPAAAAALLGTSAGARGCAAVGPWATRAALALGPGFDVTGTARFLLGAAALVATALGAAALAGAFGQRV
mmetsp:Transcript_29843/g.75078  ORF Transcript_29843/g.75078 Transcript_29843/m.75078 type:complete len:258 (+) Transcript_29843:382-1155(+)